MSPDVLGHVESGIFFAQFGPEYSPSIDATIGVEYDSKRIQLNTQIDSAEFEVGHFTQFSPGEARELAVALYQAAEEFEAWKNGEE